MERKNIPTYIRRWFAVLLIVLSLCSVIFTGCTADPSQEEVVIGIAWRADTDSEFYTNIVTAVEEAGGKPVLLEQVKADRTQDSGRVYLRADFGAGCIVTEQASADLRKFHNRITHREPP